MATLPDIPLNYFDDAIDAFAYSYDWYSVTDQIVDEYGNQKNQFTRLTIVGSMQPQGIRVHRTKEVVNESRDYKFYCKSTYRINIGDFINYNNDWLIVNSVETYDEYGVRSCSLSSVNPSMYKDLLEAIKALSGEIII